MRRILYTILAVVLIAFHTGGASSPALSQTCPGSSGFLTQDGPVLLGDLPMFGPDCGHLQDSGNPAPPIGTVVLTCGGINDTATINSALIQAKGKRLLAYPGTNCVTDPITISGATVCTAVPLQFIGYGASITARASSASPTLTIEAPDNCLVHFTLAGWTIQGANLLGGLHAQALKIHGAQFSIFQDLQIFSGTAGGIWLSGEPSFGIYYNNFQNIKVSGAVGTAGGACMIAKSINNTGNYYIANDALIAVQLQFCKTYGADVDYANLAWYVPSLEGNTSAGLLIDHTIHFNFLGAHFENNNGGATAIIASGNTTGLGIEGGRTIGSISAVATASTANWFLTTDAAGNPIIIIAGVTIAPIGTGWNAFTPSLTCGTATFTTTSALSKTVGKVTDVQIEFTITAIGTCTSPITFSLPVLANSSTYIVGYEDVTANQGVFCKAVSGSATVTCVKNGLIGFGVNNHVIASGIVNNQ